VWDPVVSLHWYTQAFTSESALIYVEAFHIHIHTVLSMVTVTKNSCGITYECKLLSELPCLL